MLVLCLVLSVFVRPVVSFCLLFVIYMVGDWKKLSICEEWDLRILH